MDERSGTIPVDNALVLLESFFGHLLYHCYDEIDAGNDLYFYQGGWRPQFCL